ncbi:hypothetical protein N9496_04635 [Akkermansiaceae bacterium]|nr:hypothetical protein [Akkermansiaceae bacterium]
MKHAAALICAIVITIAALPQAKAQVIVRLELSKSSYIINEPVKAIIYITNHAGRELTLSNENGRPWLDFNISSRGRPVYPARRINYGAAIIPAGQTVARSVSLNVSYALEKMGSYTCQAYIKMPGSSTDGFASNRAHFTVTKGRVEWSQRIGVPDAPDEIREYELLTFTGNRAMELFAHVTSTNRGQEIATIPLGKIISFRKPTGTLDAANNLHALYQVKPDLFGHSCITPSGVLKFTTFHKRGASGDPRLMIFADGEVRIAGGVLFDPVAEEEARKKVRNASERPPFIYN